MTKIYLFITAFFLFASCDDSTSSGEDNGVNVKFTQFDVTLSSGEVSIGLIDDDSLTIMLTGIKEPLNIKSVTYAYSDEVTLVTPTPESKIGDWDVKESFRLHASSGYLDYTVLISDYEAPTYTSQATIAPLETFGCITRYHMLDLNANAGKSSSDAAAYAAFGEQGMNGIRFPIYCGDAHEAHPNEGEVIESFYATPLKSLDNAKKNYYGSEPFIVFAGIKVDTKDKTEYFPNWVTTESDYIPNPEKYAHLIVDFITFMDSKGHEVGAVALTKEAAKMEAADFSETVDSIRAMTARLGLETPRMVAPELFKADGDVADGWMNELYDQGFQDSYEVYGNHYYHWQYDAAGFANLKYEYELAQTDKARPFWATEPHWDGNATVAASQNAIATMFLQTDLGLEAFMWWGAHYPITGSTNMKGPIIRAYSAGILQSQPIRMIDHDGEEVITRGKLQSRAYLRGDEVNVFLINVGSSSYEDYVVGILDDFTIDGKVIVTQWREGTEDDTGYEGEVQRIDPVGDSQFLIDIPSGSFTQLTFNITE